MDYYNPATNTERRACPQGRTSCGDAPPLRAPHHDEATQYRPPTTPTPPRSSPPSSSSRQLPPRSACCSFLRAAPAPAPAYDDYDARTTTGAFTASPTLRFLILHGPGQLKLREGRGRRARSHPRHTRVCLGWELVALIKCPLGRCGINTPTKRQVSPHHKCHK